MRRLKRVTLVRSHSTGSLIIRIVVLLAVIVSFPPVDFSRTATLRQGEDAVRLPVSDGVWLSGASSSYAIDGSFGAWRGAPVTVSGTWANSDEGQLALWGLQPGADFGNWSKPLDVAIGAIDDQAGESWAAAADGAYDARWLQSAKNLKAVWTDRGKPEANLMVRFAHEANGDWYPWKVRVGEAADFKKAYARWADIMRSVVPKAKRVFNVGRTTSVGMADPVSLWPGSRFADVYSVDYYNQDPWCATKACLDANASRLSSNGSPDGLETHRKLAESLGVPFAIPEWSNSAGNGDDEGGESPEYMTWMNQWLRAHAGRGAGQVYYEILFNLSPRYAIDGSEAAQPLTAARYKSLPWG